MSRQITITISDQAAELLEVLTRGEARPADDVAGVLEHLVHSAADGIRRPGSWERGWLVQAFGDEFMAQLETDPACSWNERPRKDRP